MYRWILKEPSTQNFTMLREYSFNTSDMLIVTFIYAITLFSFSLFSLSRALTCVVINTTKFWILIRNPFDVNRSFSVLRWNLQFYPRQFRSTMPHLIQIISCSTLCAYFGRPHKMVYHLPKLIYHCGFTFSGLG